MTKANPYTQAAIERVIRAAKAQGLTVIGVKPDGTVLTQEAGNAPAGLTGTAKPRDAREKLGVH